MQTSTKECEVYISALPLFSKAKPLKNKKWENNVVVFFYPGIDLDHSQNLMLSRLDQDPSSHFIIKIQK